MRLGPVGQRHLYYAVNIVVSGEQLNLVTVAAFRDPDVTESPGLNSNPWPLIASPFSNSVIGANHDLPCFQQPVANLYDLLKAKAKFTRNVGVIPDATSGKDIFDFGFGLFVCQCSQDDNLRTTVAKPGELPLKCADLSLEQVHFLFESKRRRDYAPRRAALRSATRRPRSRQLSLAGQLCFSPGGLRPYPTRARSGATPQKTS